MISTVIPVQYYPPDHEKQLSQIFNEIGLKFDRRGAPLNRGHDRGVAPYSSGAVRPRYNQCAVEQRAIDYWPNFSEPKLHSSHSASAPVT